jgi:alkylhydroperoxidase family enzyme
MDKRRFELATFVAAHELANTACSLAHGRALREFFSEAEIVAIAAGRVDGVLTAAEQAMLRFARQVARDASKVSAEQVAELAKLGFTDAEIFDIAAAAAGRAFFTKMLDALGVEPDAPFGQLDAAFRAPLTVGRPIDTREPVRMPAESVVVMEPTRRTSGC